MVNAYFNQMVKHFLEIFDFTVMKGVHALVALSRN